MQIAIQKYDNFLYYNSKSEIEINNSDENYIIAIYDDNDNFLARGVLYKLEDNLYYATGTVARKGYGQLLYNTLAMTAYNESIGFCMEREGGSPNERIWKLYENLTKNKNINKK